VKKTLMLLLFGLVMLACGGGGDGGDNRTGDGDGDSEGAPTTTPGEGVVDLEAGAGELVRVDPASNEIAARVSVGQGRADIFEIDLSQGLVWVGNPFEGRIYAVDSSDNTSGQGIEGGLSEGVAFAP
jgi:hypothetical protein